MIKIKYMLLSLITILSSGVHAAVQNCNNGGNVSSALHPANVGEQKNVVRNLIASDPKENLVIAGNDYIASQSLIRCSDPNPSPQARSKKPTFKSLMDSNILGQSKSFNGKKFYKITGTANAFVNKYAYIYFQYSDNSGDTTRYELDNQNGNILGSNSYTQGLRIYNLAIAFDKAPIEQITVPIIIGTLFVEWTKPLFADDSYTTTARQQAEVRLIVTPTAERTCSVNSPSVTLPTLSTNKLVNQGDTAGNTSFTLVATCGPTLGGIPLNIIMVDNKDVGAVHPNASKGILENIAPANTSDNVAIQVYDTIRNQPVTLGVEQSFGVTSSAAIPSVSRRYSARYYKLDSARTKAGQIYSTAAVTVTYR